MSYLRNEKGNATFFIIWLLGIVAILFLIIINIVGVYVVKEQANLSAEQAAIAGTSILIDETIQSIKAFDSRPEQIVLREITGEKSVEDKIEDRKTMYTTNGLTSMVAFIKAANEILPSEIEENPILKQEFRDRFVHGSVGSRVANAVHYVINKNNGNVNNTVITLSNSHWYLEVKATVTFTSITNGNLALIQEDIPQRGYGPALIYLRYVYE